MGRKKSKKSYPKKDTSAHKYNKKITLAFWAIGSLCLILGLGKVISVFGALYSPLTSSFASGKQQVWNKKFNLNFVVQGKTLSVVSLNPVARKLTIIKIPDDTYLDLPKGFGRWMARSVFDLGQAESPPIGDKLLKSSVTSLLGIPIDGVIVLKGRRASDSIEMLTESLHKNPFAPLTFLGQIDSSFTGMELLAVVKHISSTREDKTKIIDLGQSTITQSELLPDSTRVLGVDNVKLDLFVRDNLKEPAFGVFEGAIAIFNSTDHPGLAQEVARIVTNMGGNVITIGNIAGLEEKTQVLPSMDLERGNEVLVKLSRVFAPMCLEIKCTNNDSKVVSSRAQINIVVGEDFFLRQNDRKSSF